MSMAEQYVMEAMVKERMQRVRREVADAALLAQGREARPARVAEPLLVALGDVLTTVGTWMKSQASKEVPHVSLPPR